VKVATARAGSRAGKRWSTSPPEHGEARFRLLNCITVVPGALGAWRKKAIEAAGGITADNRRRRRRSDHCDPPLGWRVSYDEEAIAWTEAPETASQLIRQRYPLDLRHAAILLEAWRHAAPAKYGTLVGSPFRTSLYFSSCCR